MNSNELNKFKKQYQEIVKKRELLNSLLVKKEELEKDAMVKSYCELLNELSLLSNELCKEQNILDVAISHVNIKNTNGIYVYFGTFYDNNLGQEILVDRTNQYAKYNIYMNIEKIYSSAGVKVPINFCESFEKNNKILFPKNVFSERWVIYEKARRLFFETCISDGQEEAIEKVLKLGDNKN